MQRKSFELTDFLSKEEGVIAGYASVFNIVDQHNDLIKPGSFKKLDLSKVKFLWQHKADEPIGIIEKIKEDKFGLFFKAKLLLELPQAKDAYNLIKANVINGVSIGFKVAKAKHTDDVRVIEEIDLWEISLVTFPANIHANITEFKHFTQGNHMQENTEKLKTWENFKSVNDEVLKSLEIKGTADPLLTQQLLKMSVYLDDLNFEENEYKTAFNNYLRSGNDSALVLLEQKSLSASIDADGGYLITSEVSKTLNKILDEISPMRQLSSREVISSSSLDVLEDYTNAAAVWTAETKLVSDTDSPKINKRNIPVFEIFAQPSATQKLIDDASIDIEKWLVDKLITSFSKLENEAFIKEMG